MGPKKSKNNEGLPITTGSPVDEIKIRGLENSGNYCYRNACLQCLIQTPGFVSYFLNSRSKEKEINDFKNFVASYVSPTTQQLDYSLLKDNFGNYQTDAEEYLTYLFQCYTECAKQLFVFDFNTNRKCLNCGAIHVGNESLFVFPLGVSDSISSQRDLSNTLAMSEVIWNCATCADCECERSFTFRQTKDVLILQLNLFADDSVGDWIFLMELS